MEARVTKVAKVSKVREILRGGDFGRTRRSALDYPAVRQDDNASQVIPPLDDLHAQDWTLATAASTCQAL
jgi:hypothetical protein